MPSQRKLVSGPDVRKRLGIKPGSWFYVLARTQVLPAAQRAVDGRLVNFYSHEQVAKLRKAWNERRKQAPTVKAVEKSDTTL